MCEKIFLKKITTHSKKGGNTVNTAHLAIAANHKPMVTTSLLGESGRAPEHGYAGDL